MAKKTAPPPPGWTARLAPVREYALRDLIERLDTARVAVKGATTHADDTATINERDRSRIEHALKEADYLHAIWIEVH